MQRKYSLKPVEQQVQEEKIALEKNKDVNHIAEDATLEVLERIRAKEIGDEFVGETIDEEKNNMSMEIMNLRQQIDELNYEITELKNENEKLKSGTETPTIATPTFNSDYVFGLEDKIKELEKENDNLILKNSDLEFAKQVDENKIMNLTKQIESMTTVYTKNTYDPRHTVWNNGYKTNMNGYQDWN